MFRRWTLGRRVAVGFPVSGLTLFVVAYFGYQNIPHLVDSLESLAHTRRRLARARAPRRSLVVVMELDKVFAGATQLTADTPISSIVWMRRAHVSTRSFTS
jgi:hypothetical protein